MKRTIRQFVYLIDDDIHVGDIGDIAEAIKFEGHSDCKVDRIVLSRDGDEWRKDIVITEISEFNEDDYASVDVMCRDQAATYSLDGRA